MVALISKQVQSIINTHKPGEGVPLQTTHTDARVSPLPGPSRPGNTAAGERGMGRAALSHVSREKLP